METILVTGASGYIGSHTVLELLNKGYNVVGVDNFSNSSFESLRRVQKITGKTLKFYETDIRNTEVMETIFKENKIDPSECIMIGDTVHDIEVAHELGMDCISYDKGHNSHSKLKSINPKVISSLFEIRNHLN